VFVSRIKPWEGGGGSGGSAPVVAIISNTLAVSTVGADTQIEMVNAYSSLSFASTVTAEAYSNNKITATGDFTIEPPSSPVDGAVVNFRILASGANVNVSLDASIDIPDSSTFTSPVTIVESKKARMTLQYDADAGAWALIQFINGY
jgi:hypothetical protein